MRAEHRDLHLMHRQEMPGGAAEVGVKPALACLPCDTYSSREEKLDMVPTPALIISCSLFTWAWHSGAYTRTPDLHIL